jgi:hypothetical protein
VSPLLLAVLADGHLVRGRNCFLGGGVHTCQVLFLAYKTTMMIKIPHDSPLLTCLDLFFTFLGSRYSAFIHRLQNKLEGDGRGERGITPVTCCVG